MPDATDDEDAVSALLKRLPQRFPILDQLSTGGELADVTSGCRNVLSRRQGSKALLSQVRNCGVNHCCRRRRRFPDGHCPSFPPLASAAQTDDGDADGHADRPRFSLAAAAVRSATLLSTQTRTAKNLGRLHSCPSVDPRIFGN